MLRRLSNSQTQKVDEMTEDEATTLLLEAAQLDSAEAQNINMALPIVKELGLLPLAIDQAGAYIASGECRIQDFLSTLKAHRRDLLQIDAYKGSSDYNRAVYATWELSYRAIDKLANKDLNSDARTALQILHIFAFFHYENVMEDIFNYTAENTVKSIEDSFPKGLVCVNADGSWINLRFRQGIRVWLSYSLINHDQPSRSFSMHRLVHGWASDRLDSYSKENDLCAARTVLENSIQWNFETRDYAFRRALLPHILALQKGSLTNPREDYWKEKSGVALVFTESGKWKEAEELQVQVMKTSKRVLGEEHPDTLTSMANLASTYRNQGRWKEAEELEVQVMKTRKRVLGEEHPDTLTSMHNIAFTLESQSRNDEAISLMKKCIQIRKQILGQQHPDTESSLEALKEWVNEG